ncbi:methyltransferase [Mycobacterium tuberculosis]|nr:methyltransferase [Mycobacterium tuberculosis]
MLAAIRPYRSTLTAAVPPAALWGREDYAVGLLKDRVTNIGTRREVLLVDRFQTAQDVHYYFKSHYGPTIEAFATIGNNAVLAAALDAQLIELAHEYLVDGVMAWEYLLLTAEKK